MVCLVCPALKVIVDRPVWLDYLVMPAFLVSMAVKVTWV